VTIRERRSQLDPKEDLPWFAVAQPLGAQFSIMIRNNSLGQGKLFQM
jgi:hypothetical protein